MKTSFDIKEPGLNVLPPGVERHIVNGGGLTGLQIFPDDEIEIVNDEGNQICEIIVFDKDGKSDPGILNLKENTKNSEIRNILFISDELLFSFRFNIASSDFPSLLKTEISQIWFPSSFTISISSSGSIWTPVKPPPLTTCLSTPSGKALIPGSLMSKLVSIKYSH